MTDPFYAGRFTTDDRPYMEWDGTNESEIAAWLSSYDPGMITWTVDSIDSAGLHLHYVDDHNNQSGVYYWPVQVGQWVGPQSANWWGSIVIIDPAGRWKTPDQYGRPDRICDIEAPR